MEVASKAETLWFLRTVVQMTSRALNKLQSSKAIPSSQNKPILTMGALIKTQKVCLKSDQINLGYILTVILKSVTIKVVKNPKNRSATTVS